MYRLSRTIDATVSEEDYTLLVIRTLLVVVTTIGKIFRTTGIFGGIRKDSRWLLLAGIIDDLSLLVARQRNGGDRFSIVTLKA
jgi:Zn-dependent membrane protease YugP